MTIYQFFRYILECHMELCKSTARRHDILAKLESMLVEHGCTQKEMYMLPKYDYKRK